MTDVSNTIASLNTFNGAAESDRTVEASAARSGSWLVALATMLGQMADALGKAIVEQAVAIDTAMAGGVGEDNLTQLNAELTAMAQQMKMLQETISTIIKSIGEGNSAIARKQ